MVKRKTKLLDQKKNLAEQLDRVPTQFEETDIVISTEGVSVSKEKSEGCLLSSNSGNHNDTQKDEEKDCEVSAEVKALFNKWDEPFTPRDEKIHRPQQKLIPVNSLESQVGYSSLFRQMHDAFVQRVAFYRSEAGGSLTSEEARAKAFHACTNTEEAMKELNMMLSLPLDCLNFIDLLELHEHAPRVGERFWEYVKDEGRKEFESGHLSANSIHPVGYMKKLWNIARFLGVRESFIADWKPRGGIETSLIDMMTQSYFQWQYWLEQTIKRSQTKAHEIHPVYAQWLENRQVEFKKMGWIDGYWSRPFVSEQQALDQAVQMADRFNRIYLRTLRQLRDLRRYAPVIINNASQVNIANDKSQQVNVMKD